MSASTNGKPKPSSPASGPSVAAAAGDERGPAYRWPSVAAAAGDERGPAYRSPEERLPKVVSFGLTKVNNGWHVVALRTQGDKVLDKKLIEADLPSEAQAYDRCRLELDRHFMVKEDVFR